MTVDGLVETRPSVLVRAESVLVVAERPEAATVSAPEFSGAMEVVYEDAGMVVINKPPGVASHPSRGRESGTVLDWFRLTFPHACRAFDSERPGLVHRLDADTSGALMLGKTPAAQRALSEQLRLKEAGKVYLACVEGAPAEEKAVVDAPLGRHPADRLRMAIVGRGRAARTSYEVLAATGPYALLAVRPETGRTHQIRVHLAAIGHPIVGDAVYGRASELIGRQALHAAALSVMRPSDGRMLVARAGVAGDIVRLAEEVGVSGVLDPYLASGWELRDAGPGSQPSLGTDPRVGGRSSHKVAGCCRATGTEGG